MVIFFMLFSELISMCERFKEGNVKKKKKSVSCPEKDHSIGRVPKVILSNRALNSFMPGFAVRIYSKVFLLQN